MPLVATPGAADPETGNLTVTAGGDIPSYHLSNATVNGPSVPDLSSLPLDAGATTPTPALVYASNSVNVLPIIQVAVLTPETASLAATLTWNGNTQSTVNFTVAPLSSNVVVIDLQVASPVTASGLYPFDVPLLPYDSNNNLQAGGDRQVSSQDPGGGIATTSTTPTTM